MECCVVRLVKYLALGSRLTSQAILVLLTLSLLSSHCFLSLPSSFLTLTTPTLTPLQDLLMVLYLSNLTQMQMSLGEKLSFLTI